jgi:hypothetical protein
MSKLDYFVIHSQTTVKVKRHPYPHEISPPDGLIPAMLQEISVPEILLYRFFQNLRRFRG